MPALFKTGAIQSDVENEKNREAKKAEGLVLNPLSRAEHRRLGTDQPKGARQGSRAFSVGAGKPLRKTPFQAFGAQGISGCGAAFSLVSFFWPSKRKKLGCRAEPRL
jgi:hypothetical protein